jgi:4-amino-4-deoxy-L-arabinose transferase-like glycosyltransferase
MLRQRFLLLGLILVGFALRLYRLGADSLWYDETVSAFLASQPMVDLVAHTAGDIHPPGYYLLLRFWTLAAGHTEFALAFFSLVFGLLLIVLTYRLARALTNLTVATWAALLVTVAPYHLWYSQEVRMYTLGAALGLLAAYFGWRAFSGGTRMPWPDFSDRASLPDWLGFVLASAVGLYTLYYFGFFLIIINGLFLFYTLYPDLNRAGLRALIIANAGVVLLYLPWLPIAWWQATQPPVPPWRSGEGLYPWSMLLESWSALSLGQSVEFAAVWPFLLLTLALFMLGLLYLYHLSSTFKPQSAKNLLPSNPSRLPTASPPRFFLPLFLAGYTLGPLLLIYLLSLITPLYHVRYLFTYSPAFYIVLGAGLTWLVTRTRRWLALGVVGLVLVASIFSIYRYHTDPRYRADDYRAAVAFIEQHWQPGDIVLVNAGYVYPAFLYYTGWTNLQRQRLVADSPPADTGQPLLLQTGAVDGSPQLGWGDPQSDFYAMPAVQAIAALEKLSDRFARLWLLRAYDTVTDPDGLIRAWLVENAIPLEDEVLSGESNIRAQGFLLPGATSLRTSGRMIQFEDGVGLLDWTLPQQTWLAGQTIPVKLWWQANRRPTVDYKMSLKLWGPTGQLAAQGLDDWPAGRLYRVTTWPVGQPVYQATALTLPANLPPGQYWLNVELYHPQTGQPLPRLDGADPVATLGPVEVTD